MIRPPEGGNRGQAMKRDIIESLLIGYLATYFPVFDFSSGRIAGMLGIGILAYMIILATGKEERHVYNTNSNQDPPRH